MHPTSPLAAHDGVRPDDDLRQDDEERTAAPPANALDARRLRSAFLDLYGRPPFLAERETWSGRGLAELLDDALGNEEFWKHWLSEQLYYFLLIDNFRPQAERVRALPQDLVARRVGVRDAIHRVCLSSSFDQRNPGSDTFVSVVMEQLLGVVVQDDKRELEIGKRVYDGHPGRFLGQQGNSQADVVRIAIEDARFLRRFLEREHQRLLRRAPGSRELRDRARELDRNPLDYLDLLRDWYQSEHYATRLTELAPQSNRMFVRSLHVDLFDRLPDEDESRRMRDALDGLSDPGPLRWVIARMMLDSGHAQLPARGAIADPTQWIGELFERFLGRAAEAGELAEFVSVYHDPACRPQTIVYALLTHPDYHHY